MKHSERFANAVTKLYNAFHKGELELTDCRKCAVGNICDNDNRWFSPIFWQKPSCNIYNPLPENHTVVPNSTMIKSGYSPFELGMIESLFAKGHLGFNGDLKEPQFKGLCAVVEYLCELEGIPNVMDYSKLFETENDTPKHQLQEVFV